MSDNNERANQGDMDVRTLVAGVVCDSCCAQRCACVCSFVCVCELTLTVVKDLKAIMMVMTEVHANNDVGKVVDDGHERRHERLLEPHHTAWCVHAGRDMSSNDNLLKANNEGKLGYYPLLILVNLS